VATTKEEFQLTAQELKEEFADFFIGRVFQLPGGYDQITGTQTAGATETVEAFREDYTASQIDGQLIQKNDFKLIALAADFTTINPKTDGLTVVVDGVTCTVVTAYLDGADAAWTIQVRG
jgi:hypothetical protein